MRLFVDDRPVEIRSLLFPGGKVQDRIEADLHGFDAVMGLLLTDAVRRLYGDPRINLACPDLPYARQDRVAYQGGALPAAVACQMLNAQAYASIEVWDAHSHVSLRACR